MASTRERNGRFTGLYRDRQGRQRSAGTFPRKSQALKAARAAEALEAQGRDARMALREPETVYPISRNGSITVAGYLPQWLSGHRLEATSRESYGAMAKHVERGLGTVPLRDLDNAKVAMFFRGLEAEGKLSGSSIGHVLTVLREMCRTAVADGLLDRDPTARVRVENRRAREMTIATPAQAKKIQAAIPGPYKLLVETLFATGMRYGEAMGLEPEDITVNHVSATIQVRRTFVEVRGKPVLRDHGKTARAMRSITIETDLARRLVDGARDGFVFRAARGGYLSRSNFRRVWHPACAAAGVPSLRVHDARHSHISWLANNATVPLAHVRDRAGHASLATTSRYVHKIDDGIDPCLLALRAA